MRNTGAISVKKLLGLACRGGALFLFRYCGFDLLQKWKRKWQFVVNLLKTMPNLWFFMTKSLTKVKKQ